MIISILIFVLTFVAMEGVTWTTHKFVMHGFMWYFHEDHHKPGSSFFEKNDAFFLIFAAPSISLMWMGSNNEYDFRFFLGLGIMAYGMAYFMVHDVLIHRRFHWLDRTDNVYFRALRKAHKIHHKHLDKVDGECFGMLLVPRMYFREARAYKRNQTGGAE